MPMVKLGEVAREYKETCKGDKGDLPIVGLEHLIPKDINLTCWSDDKENTFTKMFRKGHVLFGRRRAYLKKAAVAPFDGICSGDITVIEAIGDKLYPGLLPFIIQNDALFDFAVGKSAGSLSPRVKWQHLQDYEFFLPEMAKQKELAELLWAMDRTKQAYKQLISATDELVKSQFMEQFEDTPTSALGSVCDLINGDRSKNYPSGSDRVQFGIPFINAGHLDGRSVCFDEMDYITEEKFAQMTQGKVQKGDILYCLRGSLGKHGIVDFERGLVASSLVIIRCDRTKILPMFLLIALETDDIERQLQEANNGSSQPNLSAASVKKYRIPVPPIELQEQFAAFVHQTDKSKFAIQLTGSNLNLSIALVYPDPMFSAGGSPL